MRWATVLRNAAPRRRRRSYLLSRTNASGPGIGLPGLISAGFWSGEPENQCFGRPEGQPEADFEAFPTRIRSKSGPISGLEALLRNIGQEEGRRNVSSRQFATQRLLFFLLFCEATPLTELDLHPKPYEFIWFGAMDVTKPYEFT